MTDALAERNVGGYSSGQGSWLVAPRLYRRNATRPGIIWCHGRGADHTQGYTESYTAEVARALAEAGYAYLSIDAGGTDTWGSDTAQTQLGNAKTYLQGALGAKAGKVGLMGFSMNALTVLNWARANASSVACVGLECPVVDLAYEHDQNVNGYAAGIETAYGGSSGYTSAVAAHDPMQNTSSHASGPPIKMWRATDDTIAVTARQDAFATAVGSNCQVSSLGAVGHTPATVPPTEVVAFVGANL